MSYEVLARKYRPTNFEEVVGQDHIIKALINSIDQNKTHQAFIFSGTRGVGKTTIARILAKCMNCTNQDIPSSSPCDECSNCLEIKLGRSVDFLEIDAASNTGVDKMRELIEGVEYKPAKSRYNVYLIDEVHMLSSSSFNALLKTIEEPPAHALFIFATTKPEAIPKTVQSRCLQLNLKTVSEEMLCKHLKSILEKEKLKYDDESINLISKTANGSVRDALTLLDQSIAYGAGTLEGNDIKELLGTIDDSLLYELLINIIDGNGKGAFNSLAKIEELSPEYDEILKNIISILHEISIEQVLAETTNDNIKEMSEVIDKEFCQLLYEIAMNAYSKFAVHPNPKEALEICIIRMLTFNPLQKLQESSKIREKNNPLDEKKNLKKIEAPIKTKDSVSEGKDILITNSSWIDLFNSLKLSPFARNYFGNMSLSSFENSSLKLISSQQVSEIPENIKKEFKSAISDLLSKKIDVEVLIGDVQNSPINQAKKEITKKQNLANEDIKNDKDIQDFLSKFNGKIKPDTIKPIK